ncbi:MAG: hypothetical protein IT372_19675 [Polyangiaceae bacterium]|nr:hypothetical protein [Polyangiaceae bacterium]
MKDARVTIFRTTLEDLIESLDATVRMTRWSGDEGVPEPLKESASQLLKRLGAADRLAAASFSGSAVDVARVSAMRGAMRRLDAAYVAYRQGLAGPPSDQDRAASALRTEIDDVKASAL